MTNFAIMNEYTRIKQHLDTLQLDAKNADFIDKVDHAILHLMKGGNADIPNLASEFLMPVSRFRRNVQRCVGLSPAKYVMFVRLQHSLQMLRNYPRSSISDIAYQCGFFDHSHFTHTFDRFFGISPSIYSHQEAK